MKRTLGEWIPDPEPGIRKIPPLMRLVLLFLFAVVLEVGGHATSGSIQQRTVTGTVTDESGEALPGVNIQIEGTQTGTVTDLNGKYSIEVPGDAAALLFSYVGYLQERIEVNNQSVIDVQLSPDVLGLDEVVVVGYGTQKRSDITGTVASIPKERLEMVPNLNVAQAIQGAIPGVMIQTSIAGAAPTEAIMIRGRNSIKASNEPLIVVDGIPYGGELADINPNDISSIEVLKDASAAAIYGSRGANGVILITSKEGRTGAPVISYDGRFSLQTYVNVPDMLDGEEFYQFKMEREPGAMTQSELEVYDSGDWVDWVELATRQGYSQEHNLTVSGGNEKTTYYVGGGFLDVQGIQLNDDYRRLSNRINVDSKIRDWLTIGTRTQLSFDDRSGEAPESGPYRMNPLSRAYDENGNLTIYPWPEDIYFPNPLEPTTWDDVNRSYQAVTNNYAIVDFPFIKGLSYRLNTGLRARFLDEATYKGRDGKDGLEEQGTSSTDRTLWTNVVLENILSYNKEIGKHSIFATGLYSFENNKYTRNGESARIYPNDFLSWYAASQAEISVPRYSFSESVLISQMLRLNYAYDSRYLITLTGRRDGFSGFGAETKWGIFPSVALGWNLANEEFFPLQDIFSELKIRASLGKNGNQAVGPYQTITRLANADWITHQNTTLVGYMPSTIGMDDLGWESSQTINLGLDVGILKNRITGNINLYKTNTTDLLLDRTISPVHGITSITQNIGETENQGIELSLNSRMIVTPRFNWTLTGNMAAVKNRILSLYGFLDAEGNEIDDVANKWFIGQPIRVNYDYVIEGVWQLEEAEEAALYGSQPGFVKIRDVNGDNLLTSEDRQIVGQLDPKLLWGLSNTFSYGNFRLSIFIHGVHGVTKDNEYMQDDTYPSVRRNVIKKNWWTPNNPTNDFYMNHINAHIMAGVDTQNDMFFEDASFIRIKDVSLSYDFPERMTSRIGLQNLRIYVTGRNLYTFTRWNGLDPELDDQRFTPLERQIVFGVNLGL